MTEEFNVFLKEKDVLVDIVRMSFWRRIILALAILGSARITLKNCEFSIFKKEKVK